MEENDLIIQNEKNDLQIKIEKAIRSNMISNKKTDELINIFSNNEYLNNLFSSLSSEDDYKRILFLHKKDFFKGDEDLILPRLYFSEFMDNEDETGLSFVLNKELNRPKKNNLISSMFNFPNNSDNGFWKDVYKLIAYYLILEVKKNTHIMNLLLKDSFNYNDIEDSFKGIMDMKFEDLQNDMEKYLNGDESIDPIIKNNIDIIINELINMFKDIGNTVEKVSNMIPDIPLVFHANSKDAMSKLLETSKIDYYKYIKILDFLYYNKILTNPNILFWCNNCLIENHHYFKCIGNIAPSKIKRYKCLNCGRESSFSCHYDLDKDFKEAIISKEGLLSIYFGWLLNNEGLNYKVNHYTKEVECDYIINDNTLIEVKVYKISEDKDKINANVDKTIKQIKKQIISLNKEGIKIIKCALLWNLFDIPDNHYTKLYENNKKFMIRLILIFIIL